MKILGIDPGKTNMGLCFIDDLKDFKTWKIEIFKNAKKDEKIHQLIQLEIELDKVFTQYKPDVIFHEGIAYCASNGVEESGKVEYIIERTSFNHDIPFTKLANATIRRFLGISKGEKTKDLMSLAIYKKFNVELPSQDERDAFAIAKCGEAIIEKTFELTAPKAAKKPKKEKK